jgi:glycosyltransferase involved in cell wall biosynthesis
MGEILRSTKTEYVGKKVADPIAAIIVASHRHSDNVERCLNAIASQLEFAPYEVVLVDTGNDQFFRTAKRLLPGFAAVSPLFPAGASGGRNLGALLSTAPRLIFIDDDGVMAAGCCAALVSCLDETGAVAARGRVRPLTAGRSAPHYDLGERRLPSLITCEGVSIWRRSEFELAGGFDPILYGHEGLELCARLWRFHGPSAFVYEPTAVLLHDYTTDRRTAKAKRQRQDQYRRYVEAISPSAYRIHAVTQRSSTSGRYVFLSSQAVKGQISTPAAESMPVSVVTTARNAEEFIPEFCRSWKSQTHANFEMIFVDDGSEDNTREKLQQTWGDDNRLVVIPRPFRGRGSSLNAALAAARHDLCVIADADDISVPTRLARTVSHFMAHNEHDFLSFLAYTDNDHYRIGPPHSPLFDDMPIRALFGMPVSFPTFAFRKSKFPLPFDEELCGGIDCDWLHRNLEAGPALEGTLIQYPVVYYRQHGGQITNQSNSAQKIVRKQMMHAGYSRILGELTETDTEYIDILVDRRKASPDKKRLIGNWLALLLEKNAASGPYHQDKLALALLEAFDRIHIETKSEQALFDARVAILVERAEDAIAKRDYKRARKLLKKVLSGRENSLVRRRLAATNPYWIVRALFGSEPLTKL